MQDLKNINWIILDLLGIIWLINLNHFWVKSAELNVKGTFVKASFMFVTIFLDIYEKTQEKKLY